MHVRSMRGMLPVVIGYAAVLLHVGACLHGSTMLVCLVSNTRAFGAASLLSYALCMFANLLYGA
jgi:hypothetical protein